MITFLLPLLEIIGDFSPVTMRTWWGSWREVQGSPPRLGPQEFLTLRLVTFAHHQFVKITS